MRKSRSFFCRSRARKKTRPASRREGKTGLFRLALAGSPLGRVTSPRTDHKDPSDWRDIRPYGRPYGRRQEGVITLNLFKKNACAFDIWGNKYAVGAEYIPPLQASGSQHLIGFVHHLSIRLHVRCSAMFLVSCSPLHNPGQLMSVQDAFALQSPLLLKEEENWKDSKRS